MSDIILLHPAEKGKTFGNMPPLGMAWITSYLNSKGISAVLIDLQVEDISISKLLQTYKPKIVGIGGTSHTRFESFKLAHSVKTYDPDIFVIYGGTHASFTADDTLANIKDIDAVVRGEGELSTYETVAKVLQGGQVFSNIRGISYRYNGNIVHNPVVNRIKDLDVLPFPYRDPQAIKKYNLLMDFLNIPAASIVSSRGCPVNCSFCSASAMFGTQLTFRSAVNVVDEVEMLLKDYNYQGIKFFDSTLTLNRNHIETLCAEIIRRNLKFPWECEIRVNGMSYDLLRTMRVAGCYYVDFGVESASPPVLKRMHKGITLEQTINVFKWTKDLDIYTKVFFTFGHINETIQDAYTTVEFMEKYAEYISVAATGIGVRIYPGTEVERFANLSGAQDRSFSWSLPFNDSRIESLGNDPNIPVLIQPDFGWQEFRKIEFRLARFWLKNPRAALGVLWNQVKLGRGRILLKLISSFIKTQILHSKPHSV
ncbi:MAG: B12-binding domain-containing radical SAM protein [Bacteroidetes bacterium]|nr:B12-binding domain-containing radical SAM protein [Bacteroidota bacterium]